MQSEQKIWPDTLVYTKQKQIPRKVSVGDRNSVNILFS